MVKRQRKSSQVSPESSQLSFFAQPRLGEDLSLCGGLLFVVCYAFCLRLVDVTGLPSTFSLSIFFLFLFLDYVKGIKNLSWRGGQEVWCLPV